MVPQESDGITNDFVGNICFIVMPFVGAISLFFSDDARQPCFFLSRQPHTTTEPDNNLLIKLQCGRCTFLVLGAE